MNRAQRSTVRFVRRGEVVALDGVDPNETLLDYLRLGEGDRGTKEGCAEGDCGACTVALGTLREGAVHYEPVNSCIHLLAMIDGKALVTVDDLSGPGEALHPVQSAMVRHHASQCGFCTPGFVMSLFTLYHAGIRVDRATVNDWLAGNLCRCTGYRPIVDAALESCAGAPLARPARDAGRTAAALASIADEADLFVGGDAAFFAAPRCIDSLAALHARHPDATLVGGATDVGLWITKQRRRLPRVIHTGRVAALRVVTQGPERIEIGAGATYAEAGAALRALDPDVGEVLRRLGSVQVRAAGTVGGNIANGSPIGDMPPVLIALDATLDLRRGETTRSLPLEDFFLDYGRQDRAPGEFVTRVTVPRLASDEHLRCYKVSKRFDQDISALLGAFRLRVHGRRIAAARVAFGGMAATPRRAPRTEAALAGLALDALGAWQAAARALADDFEPIDDLRASAHYRTRAAAALLAKALTEIAGRPTRETRVVGVREAVG